MIHKNDGISYFAVGPVLLWSWPSEPASGSEGGPATTCSSPVVGGCPASLQPVLSQKRTEEEQHDVTTVLIWGLEDPGSLQAKCSSAVESPRKLGTFHPDGSSQMPWGRRTTCYRKDTAKKQDHAGSLISLEEAELSCYLCFLFVIFSYSTPCWIVMIINSY